MQASNFSLNPAMKYLAAMAVSALVGGLVTNALAQDTTVQPMQLGNFSVSLDVKDLAASRAFYEKMGFAMVGGNPAQRWVVMKNGDQKIGLFQGMFKGNVLTFNPGWDSNGKNLAQFTDVRELQRQLKAKGVKLATEANESTTGPAYFTLTDPDGNMIYVDQHR